MEMATVSTLPSGAAPHRACCSSQDRWQEVNGESWRAGGHEPGTPERKGDGSESSCLDLWSALPFPL